MMRVMGLGKLWGVSLLGGRVSACQGRLCRLDLASSLISTCGSEKHSPNNSKDK